MNLKKQNKLLQKRRWRIRKKIIGTANRPRLSVSFSHKHIFAQCIDDAKGVTVTSVSSMQKDVTSKGIKSNINGAKEMGKLLAEKAKSAGINAVVFDRGGRLYHGTVKAFADAAREAGLTF